MGDEQLEVSDPALWSEWSPRSVEERLVAAFRALPGAPLFGRASKLRLTNGRACPMTQVLAWLALVEDADDRKFLATWARCKAEGESFAARCIGMGWKQATAERGRRRASAAISAALAWHGGIGTTPPIDVPQQPLMAANVKSNEALDALSESVLPP